MVQRTTPTFILEVTTGSRGIGPAPAAKSFDNAPHSGSIAIKRPGPRPANWFNLVERATIGAPQPPATVCPWRGKGWTADKNTTVLIIQSAPKSGEELNDGIRYF